MKYLLIIVISYIFCVQSITQISKNINILKILKTGTTIAAICCRDGVVLGADTKATSGFLVADKNTEKIHKLSTNIYACGCGTSADCNQLAKSTMKQLKKIKFSKYLTGDKDSSDSIDNAVSFLSNLMHNRIGNTNRYPECSFIVGGVDDYGSHVYAVNEELGYDQVSYVAQGSGATDAMASIEYQKIQNNMKTLSNNYAKYENITVNDAIAIIRKAVSAGIKNDLGSGCSIDICVIKKNETKIWRELDSINGNQNQIKYGHNLQAIKDNFEKFTRHINENDFLTNSYHFNNNNMSSFDDNYISSNIDVSICDI